MLCGLAEKNYNEQFTASISREANNTTGIRSHSVSHISRAAFAAYPLQH